MTETQPGRLYVAPPYPYGCRKGRVRRCRVNTCGFVARTAYELKRHMEVHGI